MAKLLSLFALLGASALLYLCVFNVVHRPLVAGDITRQLDFKWAYARTLASPKVVIMGGSNGRFSHRCEALAAALARPCVNASVGVGIGLDFQLDKLLPMLRRGDVVYMPLEYGQYRTSAAEMHGGLQNAVLVHDQRDYLHALPPWRIVQAYASFDLTFLIHGTLEMALDARGYKRRTSVDSLTPQGDESGHTQQAAAAYREFLRSSSAEPTVIPEASHAQTVLADFLDAAHARGVVVVGGLPTIPDSVNLADADLARLRELFESHGQRLLVLENRSRYSLDCFYDTWYHLHEECQLAHSARVGAALAAMLR